MDLTLLRDIAAREMAQHGLHDWTFDFSRAKRRLGACKYRLRRIEISEFYAANNAEESVLDTLRHEIAHALAGPRAGHGPTWKRIAARLGATPRACDTSSSTITAPGNWRAICLSCRQMYERYKAPVSLNGYRCRCPDRTPLTFEYVGDPRRRPTTPTARRTWWQAVCPGCQVVHRRTRRPQPGRWYCRCPQRSQLTWQHVTLA